MPVARTTAALFACASAFVVFADVAPAWAESRRALVIGNSRYEAFDILENPANDARDMCASLRRLKFEVRCHTDVRNKSDFIARLRDFAGTLEPDSHVVFYYAGHGVQIQGENYLVPTASRVTAPNDVPAEFVAVNEVFHSLGHVSGRFQLVVLDACRNDPFMPPPAGQPGRRSDTRSALTRGLDASKATYGLTAIKDAPAGTVVFYATASGDEAFDGRDRNGPLTKHLLAHIETPGINVEEMIKRVSLGVQEDTLKGLGKRQTPFVYSSFTGAFCFAGCAENIDAQELARIRKQLDEAIKRASQVPAPSAPAKPVFVTPTF